MVLSSPTMAHPSHVQNFSSTQEASLGQRDKPREVKGLVGLRAESSGTKSHPSSEYTEPVLRFLPANPDPAVPIHH